MNLIIKRSSWLRGEGSHSSYLLRRRDQKMCCLGFYAQACGLTAEDIQGVESPDGTGSDGCNPALPQKWEKVASWLFEDTPQHRRLELGASTSYDCQVLMQVNDDRLKDPEEREEDIAIIFARNGVNVTFVDE